MEANYDGLVRFHERRKNNFKKYNFIKLCFIAS